MARNRIRRNRIPIIEDHSGSMLTIKAFYKGKEYLVQGSATTLEGYRRLKDKLYTNIENGRDVDVVRREMAEMYGLDISF